MEGNGDDMLSMPLEAALQAAEQAYAQQLSGAGALSGTHFGSTGAALPAAARQPELEALTHSAKPTAAGSQRRRRLPHLGLTAAGDPGKAAPACEAAAPASDENLPPACYPGRLYYAYTPLEVDSCCRWVLEEGQVAALGFDIEWRVTYQAGVSPRPTALIQLCFLQQAADGGRRGSHRQAQYPKYSCLLAHVRYSGVTPHLRQLLCSTHILKAGVGVHGDAQKLRRDFGLEMGGVLCLSYLANQRLVSAAPAQDGGACGAAQGPVPAHAPQSWSLARLAARLLRLRLEKSQSVRCSNWEAAPPLSSEQQRYAAADAWASLRVYEVLCTLPVLAPPELPLLESAAPPAPQVAASQLANLLDPWAPDWVPALPAPRRLQPAKQEVHAALHRGLPVGQVAAQRRIREDTVLGYLAEAVSAGVGYSMAALGLGPEVLLRVAQVCSGLLGWQLRWRPDAPREPGRQHGEGEQPDMPRCAGSKRPPPCSPAALAAAAAAPACNLGSESQPLAGSSSVQAAGDAAAPPGPTTAAGPCQHADVQERLAAAGHTLRQLHEGHLPDVGYGQLRLALAHLSRCNPLPPK